MESGAHRGLIFLIGATGWFGVSRLVRAETLAARRLDYVDAARALGASDVRILWRHLLPNVAAPVIVSATLAIGNVIVLEAGLSYLGIGAHEPHASWGSIFFDGVAFFAGNWWVVFFPGVAIVVTVLAVQRARRCLARRPRSTAASRSRCLPEPAVIPSAAPVIPSEARDLVHCETQPPRPRLLRAQQAQIPRRFAPRDDMRRSSG